MANVTVFISYSRADTAFAQLLMTDLRAMGVTIWIDHETLQPGAPDWQVAIRRGIEAATAVIYIGTPDAARSVNVGSEVLIAQVRQRPIIPLWARGDNWIDCAPFELMRANYLDARSTDYATALTRLRQTLLSLPPHPVSSPSAPHQATVATAHVYSQPQRDGERELPTQVDLLSLFGPTRLNPGTFDIDAMWEQGRARLDAPPNAVSLSVPIGRTSAPEPLMIDFLNDGPHGQMIGMAGSGKSTLLQSLIAALAITYPPDKVNFVLVDSGGLGELDTYAELPHTLAILTDLKQSGLTARFFKMLESELRSREELRKTKKAMPRLFFIIDDFAELTARRDSTDYDLIMDQVLRALRLGRQLDVYVLLASQRPDSASARLRGYVQYRISMRTNTEEDSKETIGRADAAMLPVAVPGRGYLLHGDNELHLFQAARADLPLEDVASAQRQTVTTTNKATTAGELLVARMKAHIPPTQGRWPAPLPTPDAESPTPLVLYLHERLPHVRGTWASSASVPPRPQEMVVPIGWYDRPDQRAQGWYLVDLLGHQGPLHGGPLLVMGDANAGKTTTLQTMMLFFATQYTPGELHWFVIDPTHAFREFVAMRHTNDIREPNLSNIIDGNNDTEFEVWRERLKRAMDIDPASRGRLLVVIDDFDDLAGRLKQPSRARLLDITEEVIRSRPRGVHLALSAARQTYDTLPQTLVSAMGTKIVLHMNDRDMMRGLLGVRLPATLDPAPGRGFAQTRTTLDLIQVAAPVFGKHEIERNEGIRAILTQTHWRIS